MLTLSHFFVSLFHKNNQLYFTERSEDVTSLFFILASLHCRTKSRLHTIKCFFHPEEKRKGNKKGSTGRTSVCVSLSQRNIQYFIYTSFDERQLKILCHYRTNFYQEEIIFDNHLTKINLDMKHLSIIPYKIIHIFSIFLQFFAHRYTFR